jgi:hypothetical protein
MHMQGQLMTMEIKGQKPSLLLSLTLIVTTLTGCLRTVFSSDVVIPILNDSRYTISRWECPKFFGSGHDGVGGGQGETPSAVAPSH